MKQSGMQAVLPLFLVIFIDSLGMGIMFPILNPIYMDSTGILAPDATLQMRSLLYGVTLCVFPLFMFFASPVLGEMSDQIGRKKVLLICLIGAAISYVFSGIAVDIGSVGLLIFSRIIAGLTAGSQSIAQAAVIDVSPEGKKAHNISLLMFPACLGFVAGPLIGSYGSSSELLSWFDLSTPLYFASFFSILNAVFLQFGFKETFEYVHKLSLKLHRGVKIFLSAFKTRNIRALSIIYLCLQLGWSCYFQFSSLFLLHKYHYTANQIGIFMATLGFGFALGLGVVIRIVTKFFSTYTIVLWSFGIASASVFLTVIPNKVVFAWISVIPLAVTMALAYVLIITLYSDLADVASQGWVMGISGAVIGFSWAVMALISGLLESYSVNVPLLLAGAFMTLSTVMLWCARKKFQS